MNVNCERFNSGVVTYECAKSSKTILLILLTFLSLDNNAFSFNWQNEFTFTKVQEYDVYEEYGDSKLKIHFMDFCPSTSNTEIKEHHFRNRIKDKLKKNINYYSIDFDKAIKEINRMFEYIDSFKYEDVEMEITPNGSAIFEIKLTSDIFLIINKTISKIDDDMVVLTAKQADTHLFTTLKSIQEVVKGAKQLVK